MELAYKIVKQNPYKYLTHSHKDHDQETGIHGRNPTCTQATAWSRALSILDGWVGAVTMAGTMVAPPLEEKASTKLTIIKTSNLMWWLWHII
jgi:hypothetical protein